MSKFQNLLFMTRPNDQCNFLIRSGRSFEDPFAIWYFLGSDQRMMMIMMMTKMSEIKNNLQLLRLTMNSLRCSCSVQICSINRLMVKCDRKTFTFTLSLYQHHKAVIRTEVHLEIFNSIHPHSLTSYMSQPRTIPKSILLYSKEKVC